MHLVFVAGPYRAASEWEVEQNVRRAEVLALTLWKMGLAVICPHKNTQHYGGAASDSLWLEGAKEMVRRCDAVVCTIDWEASEGARGEVELARSLGIPIFFDPEDMHQWRKSPV